MTFLPVRFSPRSFRWKSNGEPSLEVQSPPDPARQAPASNSMLSGTRMTVRA